MRKQYYFRSSPRGVLAWDVDRLVRLSRALPRKQVLLGDIRELDETWLSEDERPTWRALLDHMRLIQETDLSFPIILSADGGIMDGRHRVARVVLEGREHIEAVQFDSDPEPDYVGVAPEAAAPWVPGSGTGRSHDRTVTDPRATTTQV